jgi:ADP-heptose:LPS heptosyltransferase
MTAPHASTPPQGAAQTSAAAHSDACLRWSGVERLLAIRADPLSDLLMTTPALAAARESQPDLHITLLGPEEALPLRKHLPFIDAVLPARLPWSSLPPGTDRPRDDMALIARLTRGCFDAAVIFTECTQSALPAALMCRLAGIPLRLAYSRENPHGLLTDWLPEPDVDPAHARHEVQRQLDLVAHVGWSTTDDRLRFELAPADLARVDALLDDEAHPLVAVNVGASAFSNAYPPEGFGVAAEAIARAAGATIVFTGTEPERPLVAAARHAMHGPSIDLAGALSVGELAAVLARAQLLVSSDTGPVQLAAAVGTPVVDVYALGDDSPHGPWRIPARVLHQDAADGEGERAGVVPGLEDSLARVPPMAVRDAALELLAAVSPGPAGARGPGPRRAAP